MHAIHHTEAVIIKSFSAGEANKRVWLFTKEFGLVVALVQGVRKPGAKLASHISDYAFIKADLVKGKEVWRLISANVLHEPLAGKTRTPLARAYVRTLSAVDRFLVDEGPHDEIYAHIQEVSALLGTDVPAKAYDTLSIWRMLAYLGYIAVQLLDQPYQDLAFKDALMMMDEATINRLSIDAVNAIKESHL